MEKITKSIFRIFTSCIFLSICLIQSVVAKDYPDRPVKLIVPWPAGGLVDIAGRVTSKTLQTSLSQPFIVDNKLGAGGILGADSVAKAPADGYTLLLTTSALNINNAIRISQPYDVANDFVPISLIAWSPFVLVASQSLGVTSVQELIQLAKSKPGKPLSKLVSAVVCRTRKK